MIQETPSGNKLTGFYRGIVLEQLTHGYCKIFIPGVNPIELKNKPDMLPPAEQAASLFGGTNNGNGEFSYPNLSSIVWCFFANGDQNMPVYFASSLGGQNAFGQFELAKDTKDKQGKVHILASGKSQIKISEEGNIQIAASSPNCLCSNVTYNQKSYFPKYSKKLKDDKVSKRPIQEKVDSQELSSISSYIDIKVIDSTDESDSTKNTTTAVANAALNNKKDEKYGIANVNVHQVVLNQINSNQLTVVDSFSRHNTNIADDMQYIAGVAALSTDGAGTTYEFNSSIYSNLNKKSMSQIVKSSKKIAKQAIEEFQDGIMLSSDGIAILAATTDKQNSNDISGQLRIITQYDDSSKLKSGLYLEAEDKKEKFKYINYGNLKDGNLQIKIEDNSSSDGNKCYIEFNAKEGNIVIDCPNCLTLHSKQILISADTQLDLASTQTCINGEIETNISSKAINLDAHDGHAHVITIKGKKTF